MPDVWWISYRNKQQLLKANHHYISTTNHNNNNDNPKAMAVHWIAACALLLMTSSAHAQEGQKEGKLKFESSTPMIVDGVTDQLTLECKQEGPLTNLDSVIGLFVWRQNANGSATVARLKSTRAEVPDISNRTTVEEGSLQTSESGKPSNIKVVITDPTVADSGVYTCLLIYLRADPLAVEQVAASVNVSFDGLKPILPQPPVQIETPESCNCSQVLEEVHRLIDNLPAEGGHQHGHDNCHVSFSAKFKKNGVYRISDNERAHFNDVFSNKGGAFDDKNETFTAPCGGQYFFTLTLMATQDMDSGYVDGLIMADGQVVAQTSVFVNAAIFNRESGSNGVVVSLKKGQRVYVHIRSSSSGQLVDSAYSVFSGFFLSH